MFVTGALLSIPAYEALDQFPVLLTLSVALHLIQASELFNAAVFQLQEGVVQPVPEITVHPLVPASSRVY